MKCLSFRGLFAWMLVLMFSLVWSCKTNHFNQGQKPLFSLLDKNQTHIDFSNQLNYTENYNTYTYRNFYNGAGVGLGDFNNDGLSDIYFCGNLVDNKLYINKGNFVFEDVTEYAGVACHGSWSTGVSIADINGDGWLDIYVCKSGDPNSANRQNELFINNGDLTFSEKASEYGIDETGLSNHASFFDYDRDGDLDCYLLSNSFQSVTEFDIKPGQRLVRDTLGGNKLFRNDGGRFLDVSDEAGIYGSKIGFGLGVSVGDVNRDGWMDIYVSNDFFERDYLYLNNQDGSFSEVLEDRMSEISLGAMGGDIADINNDTYPEIFATEMTPEGNARLKTKTMFDSWERYQTKFDKGYYHQFARNVLQLNNQGLSFSEIGRYSGVSATDWSWGALIMDLDNDGWKDIFVANGIFKDLLDRDYLDLYSNPAVIQSMIKTEEKAILKLIDLIPSVEVPNYTFHNNGDLTFTNLSDTWGMGTPSFSNGAAYGDLDNDGDLDLIVNNVNMPPFVYRNETQGKPNTNFLEVKLKGDGKNTAAIGAEVTLYYNGLLNYQELIPMRGFQSSVEHKLHFGIGASKKIDSLIVVWPNGKSSALYEVAANQILVIDEKTYIKSDFIFFENNSKTPFEEIESIKGIDYQHVENDYNDFDRDKLLFQMVSNEGPRMAVGDLNGDALDDIFICGAKDSPAALFIQEKNGHFNKTNILLFETDKISEDTDCAFFDADADGDLDLYVASGSNELPESSSALADRLYFNNGNANFTKSGQILPAGNYESTSCVQPADFDNDGDIDLFVGIRLRPFSYGMPVNGYLLENNGIGDFSNVSNEKAPELTRIGMITDMAWADIDNDNDLDMVIVGDWMPVKIFINTNGIFSDKSIQFGLSNTEGWWNVVATKDLNNDGYVDFVLGNHGLNTFFKTSVDKPITMFVNDFDINGSVEQIICSFKGDKSYPVPMMDDLVKQIPLLANRYKKFEDYKDATIHDLFSEDLLQKSIVLNARLSESCVMINTGEGKLQLNPLPAEAQFSPVYAIFAEDFNNNGECDILIGGNQNRAKPETGIYEASYGLLLEAKNNGIWESVSNTNSGFYSKGEIRDLKVIKINGERIIVVARNNNNLKFYKNQ